MDEIIPQFLPYCMLLADWCWLKCPCCWDQYTRPPSAYRYTAVWVKNCIFLRILLLIIFFYRIWEFQTEILHAYCVFISTQNYRILFKIYLLLALSKLCHIKREHSIAWKKREQSRYLCYGRSPQNLTRWCKTCLWNSRLFRISVFKIQDGGRLIRLRDPFCIIKKYRNLSLFSAVRHLGFLKLKILTAEHF